LILGCAQVKSPVGGDKDQSPPKVLKWIPDSLPTRFSAQKFELIFDEYIQINNVAQELIVSPPLKVPPKVQLKGKGLLVSWGDTLRSNTTYQFHFGNSVADYHEGNKVEDLKFVFSTGSFIDSLSISGVVRDAWTLEPLKSSRILMNDSDTGIVTKKPIPRAIAISNPKGGFILNFLHEGSYYLAAIDDQNSNYRWDEGEGLDWLDNQISPTYKDSDSVRFFLSVPRSRFIKVPEVRIDSSCRMVFLFKAGDPEVSVRALDDSLMLSKPYQFKQDSMSVHVLNKNAFDNLRVEFSVGKEKDTIALSLMKEQIGKKIRTANKVNDKLKVSDSLFVRFNQPVFKLDSTKITVAAGKTVFPIKCGLAAGKPDLVWIDGNWKAGDKLNLECVPGAIESYTGGMNDTIQIPFTIMGKMDLADLVVDLSTQDLEHPVFLLLNKSNEIVMRLQSITSQSYRFTDLIPGEYSLLCFDDLNQNLIWDPADLETRNHAEPVWRFGSTLQLRANWEVQHKWEIVRR
jgi:hypothetical protein